MLIDLGFFHSLVVSISFSSLAVIFWIVFWYFYSRKKTTPLKMLVLSFILGIVSAIIAGIFEKEIIANLFGSKIYLVDKNIYPKSFDGLVLLVVSIFFLTALPEEILKFFAFKIFLFKSNKFDQIIDGIKFGIFIGLGFALVENSYLLFHQLEISNFYLDWSFFYLFIPRFLITTLVHSLYGGVIGYYFGLGKFYKVFRSIFLWQGFLIVLFIHSTFNFLILTPFNILTFILILFVLIILFKWYNDRKNVQVKISKGLFNEKKPIFSGKKEIQALIAKETNSNFRIVKDLGFCPYCFGKIKKGETVCPHCGRKLN